MRNLIAFVVFIVACSSSAQDWKWPEKPQNLKVLTGFSGPKLAPVMKGFTRALGVRCTYCHVGEEGKPLSTYDFASDANPNKDRARAMLRMLGSINDQLKAIPSSGETRVNMWCHTCHAGRARPMTLEEELHETFKRSGLQAMLARYHELHEKYYGRAGYDFSERSLSSMGQEALRAGETEAAIAILRVNATDHPASTLVWGDLGDAYAKAAKPQIAAIYYRKALEIEPSNEDALKKLHDVESKP